MRFHYSGVRFHNSKERFHNSKVRSHFLYIKPPLAQDNCLYYTKKEGILNDTFLSKHLMVDYLIINRAADNIKQLAGNSLLSTLVVLQVELA